MTALRRLWACAPFAALVLASLSAAAFLVATHGRVRMQAALAPPSPAPAPAPSPSPSPAPALSATVILPTRNDTVGESFTVVVAVANPLPARTIRSSALSIQVVNNYEPQCGDTSIDVPPIVNVTSAFYSFRVNANACAGIYTVDPVVTDAAGNVATHSAVRIRLNRALPNTPGFCPIGGRWHLNEPPSGETWYEPDHQSFVKELYRRILHRDPVDAEVQGWVNALSGFAPSTHTPTRQEVAAFFFRSPEYQRTGFFVAKLFQLGGHSVEHPDESLYLWEQKLKGEVTREYVAGVFLTRTGYDALNNHDFVKRLYVNLLKRDPSPAGAPDHASFVSWVSFLDASPNSADNHLRREQVAIAFVDSPEFNNRMTKTIFAEVLIRELLQRGPVHTVNGTTVDDFITLQSFTWLGNRMSLEDAISRFINFDDSVFRQDSGPPWNNFSEELWRSFGCRPHQIDMSMTTSFHAGDRVSGDQTVTATIAADSADLRQAVPITSVEFVVDNAVIDGQYSDQGVDFHTGSPVIFPYTHAFTWHTNLTGLPTNGYPISPGYHDVWIRLKDRLGTVADTRLVQVYIPPPPAGGVMRTRTLRVP